jgi:broad specificity phosphatase PhoE
MPIIIVRHGETQENKNRIIQGQQPGQLTETGRRQVRDLSLKLRKYGPFDQIISSDLERARETADLISKELPPCKIVQEEQLRERCYGQLEGKPVYQWKRLLVKNKRDLRALRIPDGEPYEDFELRITDVYRRLIADKPDQNTIVVTHAGVMQVILVQILGRTWSDLGNCEGFRLSFTANRGSEVHSL